MSRLLNRHLHAARSTSRPANAAADAEFDGSIRMLVATAAASAPRPPMIEQLDELTLRRLGRSGVQQRRSPWLIAGPLVAAAALIGGVVLVADRNDGERQGRKPAVGTPARQSEFTGLPVHVLPTYVPDGWKLVDVTELVDTGPTAAIAPAQLFRRTSDGAAIRLEVVSGKGVIVDPNAPEPADTVAADPAPDVTEAVPDAPPARSPRATDSSPIATDVMSVPVHAESNHPPVVVDDVVSIADDGGDVYFSSTNNDFDPDGDVLTVQSITPGPRSQDVVINVLANDVNPDGDVLILESNESDAPLIGGGPAVQASAPDRDEATGALVVSSFVQGGVQVSLLSNGVMRFQPRPGELGTQTFQYTLTDGQAEANASVTIQVIAVSDGAQATPEPPVTEVLQPGESADADAPSGSTADDSDGLPALDEQVQAARELARRHGLTSTRTEVAILGGTGGFVEPDGAVQVETVGISDVDAQRLVRSLVRDVSSDRIRFEAPAGAGLVIDAETAGGFVEVDSRAVGYLTYLVDGALSLVWVQQIPDSTRTRFGLPVVVDGAVMYASGAGFSRELSAGTVISGTAGVGTDPDVVGTDPDVVGRLLASAEVVERSAWEELADGIASRALDNPALGEVELVGDVRVSEHLDGELRLVCAADATTARCHTRWVEGRADDPTEGMWFAFDIGDGWVFAGSWPDMKTPITDISAELDRGTMIDSGWAELPQGALVAVAVPDEATAGTYAFTGGPIDHRYATDGDLSVPII